MVLVKVLNNVVHNDKTYYKNSEVVFPLNTIDKIGAQNFEIIRFLDSPITDKSLSHPIKDKMMRFPDMCKDMIRN